MLLDFYQCANSRQVKKKNIYQGGLKVMKSPGANPTLPLQVQSVGVFRPIEEDGPT